MSMKKKVVEPSFEEAQEKLESFIKQMEEGDLALQDMVDHYEKAMGWLQVCSKHLKNAEIKITTVKEKYGIIEEDSLENQ